MDANQIKNFIITTVPWKRKSRGRPFLEPPPKNHVELRPALVHQRWFANVGSLALHPWRRTTSIGTTSVGGPQVFSRGH